MADYQLLVIGAGPGGYVCALRAAQLGLKTACVESWRDSENKPALGGTCLNVGCIPSKALLDSSHLYMHLGSAARQHGIHCGSEPHIDIGQMQKRKQGIVHALTGGIAGLFRKHKIDWIQGHARLLAERRIGISHIGARAGEQSELSADHIVIATGSVPAAIPQATVNQANIVDSSGALEFAEVPARIGVIGAGVIGLELGSVWARLGADVTLLEAMSDFLPTVDSELSAAAYKAYTAQGLKILLGASVDSAVDRNDQVKVQYLRDGTNHDTEFDKLIVAVGRKPNTSGLDAANVGLKLGPTGHVHVDPYGRTNLAGVLAIGDVTDGPMLAHRASEDGVRAAELIAGHSVIPLDYDHVPWVIYTWPELAWVGKSARQLQADGHEFTSGVFPFYANGRAKAMGETSGMVKLLADARTDRLLGTHIFGPGASELIAEAVLALELQASAEDVARTIHAHPTLSEAVHEAALGISGETLHI